MDIGPQATRIVLILGHTHTYTTAMTDEMYAAWGRGLTSRPHFILYYIAYVTIIVGCGGRTVLVNSEARHTRMV